MKVALLGFGYWGKILLNKLKENKNISHITIFSRNLDKVNKDFNSNIHNTPPLYVLQVITMIF